MQSLAHFTPLHSGNMKYANTITIHILAYFMQKIHNFLKLHNEDSYSPSGVLHTTHFAETHTKTIYSKLTIGRLSRDLQAIINA